MSTHTDTTAASTTDGSTALVDPRPAFERALDIARAVIAAASGRFDDPTPCDEMNVRDLIRHLHAAVRRAEVVTTLVDPSALPTDDVSIADDDWVDEFADAAAAAVRAWSDDGLLTTTMVLPWTQASGAQVLGVYLNEVLVHAWDLATATGQSPEWNDADAELAMGAIRRELPMPDRAEMWAEYRRQMPPEIVGESWAAPFGDAVEVAAGTGAIERLVAWQGRRP